MCIRPLCPLYPLIRPLSVYIPILIFKQTNTFTASRFMTLEFWNFLKFLIHFAVHHSISLLCNSVPEFSHSRNYEEISILYSILWKTSEISSTPTVFSAISETLSTPQYFADYLRDIVHTSASFFQYPRNIVYTTVFFGFLFH